MGRNDLKLHIDLPRGVLINNLGQQMVGWIASTLPLDVQALRLRVNGEEIPFGLTRREDVERALPGHQAIGWHFLLDRRLSFDTPRRLLKLEVVIDGCVRARRVFCTSRHLLAAKQNSPLYFMHIPKTAGTALRHLVDYVFAGVPSLLVYGDAPGVAVGDVPWLPRTFLDSREIVFGHFDFGLARLLSGTPKIVTVLRRPSELMRSYIEFSAEPQAEFLDNPMVRYLSGIGYMVPFGGVTEEHFRTALHHVREYCFVAVQERLQEFADELVALFELPPYVLDRVNETVAKAIVAKPLLPVDIRFDVELYAACCDRRRSLVEFLDA